MPAESSPSDVAEEVRRFLSENFYLPAGHSLADADSLLERGVLDSTGVLQLVAYLERRYGIKVADTELMPENLDSVSRIAAFVVSKRAA